MKVKSSFAKEYELQSQADSALPKMWLDELLKKMSFIEKQKLL